MTTIGESANPFDHDAIPGEPPRGTVLAYQITFFPAATRVLEKDERRRVTGTTYDYVSFRAGNGSWYTTGKRACEEPETWDDFWSRLNSRGYVSEIKFASSWDLFSTGGVGQ